MKVLHLADYFPPYATGGSEWSVYYLANSLSEVGVESVVVSPNYDKNRDSFELLPFKTIRIPFYLDLKKFKDLSSVYFFNPLWVIWSSYYLFNIIIKEKSDVIHLHGRYFIIPIFLINFILQIKIIITARDYQILCNYGFCLYQKDKICSLEEYFLSDFKKYYQGYVRDKSLNSLLFNILAAIWMRLITRILNAVCRNFKIVVLSNNQRKIFEANGFRDVVAINNSFDFPEKIKKINIKRVITYAGRLTPGKGILIFSNIINQVLDQYPKYKIQIIGEGFLKLELVKKFHFEKRVAMLGQVDHQEVMKFFESSSLVIVPSLWPEPFGRVALEGIAVGTPVLVSNRGGLPEIIKNKRWGFVAEPNERSMFKGIDYCLEHQAELRANIKKDYPDIVKKFNLDVRNKYIKVYQEILK